MIVTWVVGLQDDFAKVSLHGGLGVSYEGPESKEVKGGKGLRYDNGKASPSRPYPITGRLRQTKISRSGDLVILPRSHLSALSHGLDQALRGACQFARCAMWGHVEGLVRRGHWRRAIRRTVPPSLTACAPGGTICGSAC